RALATMAGGPQQIVALPGTRRPPGRLVRPNKRLAARPPSLPRQGSPGNLGNPIKPVLSRTRRRRGRVPLPPLNRQTREHPEDKASDLRNKSRLLFLFLPSTLSPEKKTQLGTALSTSSRSDPTSQTSSRISIHCRSTSVASNLPPSTMSCGIL